MRSLRGIVWVALAAAFVAGVGCESAGPAGDGAAVQDPPAEQAVVGREKWNSTNSPTVFSNTLEYQFSKLPKEGRADNQPWPDTYWPTYEDSINVRWQLGSSGEAVTRDKLSPAEKYDLAFNGWNPDDAFLKLKPYSSSNCADKSWDKDYYTKLGPAAKWTAQNKGNWDAHNGYDDDGDGKTDECDDRDGVETWWGLCHAWVPAAILEKEPQKPVTHNGVRFEVADIKALLQAMYDPSSARLVGGRCNDKEVKRDEKTGRILADQCRDVNPGTYHVLMANYLGKMKKAIAEDRTYDYQVWNQPIIAWKVDSVKEITTKEAIKLLGLPATTTKYPHTTGVKKLYEVYSTTSYITESNASTQPFTAEIDNYTRNDQYHYILEIGSWGKIIGGEWLGSSHTNHPDFLWLPLAAGGSHPHIDWSDVKMLLEKSLSGGGDDPSGVVKEYASTGALDIPDNNATGVTGTISVPDTFNVGSKVDVELDITHTYIGDLTVKLVKGSKTATLHNKTGGSARDIKKTFTVTDFGGEAAEGDWKLVVTDTANADTGKVNSWRLKIAVAGGGDTPPAGSTITAAATDCPVAIKDNTPAGSNSTITVAEDKTVKSVKVKVNITHSYIGSLVVKLTHGGKTATLHDQAGADGTSINTTFGPADFNGGSSKGAWVLNAADIDAYDDTGNIVGWSLEIGY
ncbi:MAG: proprotein convertase P-domain-containing protein [Deltaproteobacteria bacterium]|nr:proprotein convertase P-domain-containing protein [Deltaproteobacteria bacterium]